MPEAGSSALTIYLLTGWLGDSYPVLHPFSHKYGHLWVVVFGGSTWAWAAVMGLSLGFLLAGLTLLSKGWRLVHGAEGYIATAGVYQYVRHPQYTGLFSMIVGFLIQWPTLLTVVVAPVFVLAYVRLARSEEQTMYDAFGPEYGRYATRTPMFLPPLGQWRAFLWARCP